MHAEKVRPRDSSTVRSITREDLENQQKGLGDSWLEAVAPQESDKLQRRFRWSGLDVESLANVLAQLHLPLENSGSERWIEELGLLRAALQSDCDRELEPFLEEVSEANPHQLPFSDLWLPAVDAAVMRLRASLVDLCNRRIDDEVFASLGRSLLTRLCSISEQALFEQFNLQRPPGAMLLAHLGANGDGEGPPVREYYKRFIRAQRRDGLKDLLETFYSHFTQLRLLLGMVEQHCPTESDAAEVKWQGLQ